MLDAYALSLDDRHPIELRLLCPRTRPFPLMGIDQFQKRFLFRCWLQILYC